MIDIDGLAKLADTELAETIYRDGSRAGDQRGRIVSWRSHKDDQPRRCWSRRIYCRRQIMGDITTKPTAPEETAVDDVRRIREQFDREFGGDIHKHVQQTNRVVEALREKLGPKIVQPPDRQPRRDAANG